MRWLIAILFFLTNSLMGQFTYSGYLYNANGSGANNVPVKLYKSTAGATTKSMLVSSSAQPRFLSSLAEMIAD